MWGGGGGEGGGEGRGGGEGSAKSMSDDFCCALLTRGEGGVGVGGNKVICLNAGSWQNPLDPCTKRLVYFSPPFLERLPA